MASVLKTTQLLCEQGQHHWEKTEEPGNHYRCAFCNATYSSLEHGKPPPHLTNPQMAKALDKMAKEGVKDSDIIIRIPPEVAQYKDDIRRFVDAMVYKLAAKAHKGRWENMPIDKAMELLRGEEAELTEAIERGNLVEVLLEAADVGNFALIVSAIAIERGK